MEPFRYTKQVILLFPMILLTIQIPSVQAVGSLYVDPQKTSTLALGSTFNVKLKVANLDLFNSWDISVQTNNTVISPQNLSITGNVIATNTKATAYELVNCVNGGVGIPLGSSGNVGCTITDGPGIARSAVAALGNASQTVPINGLLFTITYKVVGKGTYSPIHVFDDQIANSQGIPVPYGIPLDGVYGTAPLSDFSLSTAQPYENVTIGQSANSTITLNSLGVFSGSVALTASFSVGGYSSPVNGFQASLVPSTVSLSAGGSGKSVLRISTNSSTPSTQVTVVVTGQSGSLTHSIRVNVSVLLQADFILAATPSLLQLHSAGTGASTIIVSSTHLFSGTIHLNVQAPTGSVSLSTPNITLSSGSTGTSRLTVTAPQSYFPFDYKANVTATSSSLHHTILIDVRPPQSDFNFTVSPQSISAAAGSSETFNVTVSSRDYFQGTVYFFATALSGARLSFNPSSVTLNFGNTLRTSLTISTDQTALPGVRFVVLTAVGNSITAADTSITHSNNVTVNLESARSQVAFIPRSILGLQPLTYFGVLGILTGILAAITVVEVRRGQPRSTLLTG